MNFYSFFNILLYIVMDFFQAVLECCKALSDRLGPYKKGGVQWVDAVQKCYADGVDLSAKYWYALTLLSISFIIPAFPFFAGSSLKPVNQSLSIRRTEWPVLRLSWTFSLVSVRSTGWT